MKKILFTLLVLIISVAVNAQFTHTKWAGAIKGDNPQNATLKFGKDTVVLSAADGSVIETMTFSVKAGVMVIKKIAGQSDCDTIITGKYKIEITGSTFGFVLVTDACNDRATALNKTKWKKS